MKGKILDLLPVITKTQKKGSTEGERSWKTQQDFCRGRGTDQPRKSGLSSHIPGSPEQRLTYRHGDLATLLLDQVDQAVAVVQQVLQAAVEAPPGVSRRLRTPANVQLKHRRPRFSHSGPRLPAGAACFTPPAARPSGRTRPARGPSPCVCPPSR